MLGLVDLKDRIKVTDEIVECPIRECSEKVERQRRYFRRQERFKCRIHDIYISPSTFEYDSYWDNMLWKDRDDRELFSNIKKVKRECRISRDNSEDAVTWNIFRYLEKEGLIAPFLSNIAKEALRLTELIYWSYGPREKTIWALLRDAREEFGEDFKKGSEPDIIVLTDRAIFFIEAKLFSGNITIPSDPDKLKKYETGGNRWFSQIFESNFQTLAIKEKKYELFRLWLLGTWMAKRAGKDFYLINLVLRNREINIENMFKKHIKMFSWCKFVRSTWEDIYQFILDNGSQGQAKEMIIHYYKNKTMGYDQEGKIQKAFSI